MTDHPHIATLHGLGIPLAAHPARRRLRRRFPAPTLHGYKLWNAAFLLIDYLHHHPLPPRSRVLEVGCGWGLPSVYCARHQQAHVTATDADPAVFRYLDLLAELNDASLSRVQASFGEIDSERLAGVDVLIGADICFWDPLESVVFDVIGRALESGVRRVLISDPLRPPFIRMAEHCVEQFFGELHPWSQDRPRRMRGGVLVIENA